MLTGSVEESVSPIIQGLRKADGNLACHNLIAEICGTLAHSNIQPLLRAMSLCSIFGQATVTLFKYSPVAQVLRR